MAGEQTNNEGRMEERQRTIGASHEAPKEEVEAHHTRVKDIAEVTSWITSDRWPEKYSSEEMKAQCRRIVKIWEARENDFLLRFPEVNGEFFTELPPEGLAEELAPPLPTSKDDELVSVGGRTSRRRRGRKGKLATVKEEEDREDQTPAPTQATENAAAQETTNLPQGFRKGTNVLYHPLREVREWLRDFGLVWDERRPRDVVEAAKRAVEDGQAGDEQLLTAQDFSNVVYDGDDPSFVNNDGRVGPHKLGMKPWEDFFLCWNSFKHGCARPNCQYRHLFLCQKECELAIVRGGEKAYQFLLDWASARSWNRTVDLRVLPQAPAVERPAPATPRRGRGRGVAGAVYSARGLSNARAAGQHIRWEQDERSRQCLTENFWRGGKRLLEPERAVESKRRRLSGEEDENLSTGYVDKIKEEEEED